MAIHKKTNQDRARRLRTLRDNLGLTQREMAQHLRVSHAGIALWESGRRSIPGPVLKLMEIYEEQLGLVMSSPTQEIRQLISFWKPKKFAPTNVAGTVLFEELKAALHLKIDQIAHGGKNRSQIELTKQIAMARRFADAVVESKGLGLKIVQMLGVFEFTIPDDDPLREVLKAVRDDRKSMSPLTVAKIIYEELGQSPNALFADWDPQPIARASLGQVHKARLHSGEFVAVKIQYQNIEKNMTSDLSTISNLSKLCKLIFVDRFPGDLIDEFKNHLLMEFDYHHEADNQEKFRSFFINDAEIYVPKVFRELTTKNILTTEFIEGKDFESFCKSATQKEKNRAGELIWDFHARSKVHLKMFNTDSQTSNFIFQKNRVVCLDFGCVKRFDDKRIEHLKQFCAATLSSDDNQLAEVYKEIGFLKDTACDKKSLRSYHNVISAAYLDDQPFRFTPEYFKRLSQVVQNPPVHLNLMTPKDEVMAARQFFGTWSLLCSLQAQADWQKKMIEALD